MDRAGISDKIDNFHLIIEDILQKHPHITIEDMKPTSSSGSCVVILIDNANFVVQYYLQDYIAEKVYTNYMKMISEDIIITPLKIQDPYIPRRLRTPDYVADVLDIKLAYLTEDYIVKLIERDENTFVWNKITALNSIPESDKSEYVKNNLWKLLWDIGKALTAIHSNGVVHRDCTIDNIGVNDKGDYCLFDFDSSRSEDITEEMIKNDFNMFEKSIKFHYSDYSPMYSHIEFLTSVIRKLHGVIKDETYLKITERLEQIEIVS